MLLLLLEACRYVGPHHPRDTSNPATVNPDTGETSADTACIPPIDADGDGWDRPEDGGSDCDDGDPDVHPGADDVADGIDADCDGADAAASCVPTTETCDGTDEDCDGRVDDRVFFGTEAPWTVATGNLLADGAAVVVGVNSGGDGWVKVYDAGGTLITTISGDGQSQSFGEHLAIGDLTGDGVADLVVSAPWAAVEKVPNKGRIFLFAGPLDAETTLASAVGTFEGGDLAGQPGTTLGILPDVTGDGVAELVVGYYRFVLLFSGLPLGAGTADAFASLEMNTGGGLWTFSTAPDADGDGLAELVLGMPSYAGTGFVGQWNSGRLTGTLGAADRTWVGTAAALGGALARVGDTVWTLAGSSPVPLTADGVGTALDVEATTLAAADIDGDGVDELLSGGDAIVAVDRGTWPFAGALVADPVDIDGDGADDPAVLRDGEALILEGARAFTDGCDADGDGVSLATDCDDGDPTAAPGAAETCDGADDDCDGVIDAPTEAALSGRAVFADGLGDLDGDGGAELAWIDGDGLVTAMDGEGDLTARTLITSGRATFDRPFGGLGDEDLDGFPDMVVSGEEAA